MAFGITRDELVEWKKKAVAGEISFLTHYWLDERFPGCTTVTKVACVDIDKLVSWGEQYGLKREWIDTRNSYPHFDLFAERQRQILKNEGLYEQLERFSLMD